MRSLVFQFGFTHFQYLISRLIYAGKQLSTTFYCICWRWHLINIVISLIFSLWGTLQKRFPLLLNVWAFVCYFLNLLFNKNALTLGNSPRKYIYLGKLAAHWCTTLQSSSYSTVASRGSRLPSFLYYLERKLPRNWELHLSNYLYSWQALRSLEMII